MACACKGRKNVVYVWTDGVTTAEYETRVEAKAKVLRKGGYYTEVKKGG